MYYICPFVNFKKEMINKSIDANQVNGSLQDTKSTASSSADNMQMKN